jgi:hypothetical protein
MLRRLLLDALLNPDRSDGSADPDVLVSDAARAATEWIGVGADQRERALRELLELADAVRPYPPRALSLPDKVSRTHQVLAEAEIPHAFGGALAVAYYGEPRSTLDIDVNVFLPIDHWRSLCDALVLLVDLKIDREDLGRSHEARIEWDPSSLHLFFSSDPLHERMRAAIRSLPFNGGSIPIVSPEHLVIRKAILDRAKDWHDIEQIFVASDGLAIDEVEGWLERMAGSSDPRMKRLAGVKAALSLD